MKVVILHQHFNTPSTGGGIRSWYLAKTLVKNGIEVTVVTAHNGGSYLNAAEDGMTIHYLPVAYDNRFGFGARGWAFLSFAWKCARLKTVYKDATLCYAISAPLTVGWAALMIRRHHHVPFFFEVGDLWPDAPVQMGFIKNYLLQQGLYALEKRIYKKADAIVALSTAIESAIEIKVPGKRITVIPNMADCDFYQPEKKNPFLEKKFGAQGRFVISYIGAIGFANGLDYFLECANLSRKQELPIQFLICGNGALRERLVGHAKKLHLSNLTFIDFQNRDGVKELLNVSDAAFVCYKRVPVLETGSPNKFFDGLAAGKLIIVNFGGWIRNEIEENKCGFYADPNQPADFTQKIKPFLVDSQRLRSYQTASRELAERKYSRELLGEKFVQAIRSSQPGRE